MTDFNKVQNYYEKFDEWMRLDHPSGRLEFELTFNVIVNHLIKGNSILDLGGGPGRYTIELAKLGYDVSLADLSEDLLNEARNRVSNLKLSTVKSISQVNAIDLSCYQNESFDVVLLLGPLYHLTKEEERISCVKEVYRILKPNGIIIASYIPYLSGAIGVVDRYFRNEAQVNEANLFKVFQEGIFNNNSSSGFQEGYYPKTNELIDLFAFNGFKKESVRSVRGFGYMREEPIMNLKKENIEMYHTIIELINKTAYEKEIVETNGHALYIGVKETVYK